MQAYRYRRPERSREVIGELGGQPLLKLGLSCEVTQGASYGAEAGDHLDGPVGDVGVAEEGQEVVGAEAVERKPTEAHGVR